MDHRSEVIFDGTGGANAAFDTGNLDVSKYDELGIQVIPSGAAAASSLSLYDTAFSTVTPIRVLATGATNAVKSAALGPAAQPAAAGEYVGGQPGPVPPSVRIGIGALGVGITARIRVIARKRIIGP